MLIFDLLLKFVLDFLNSVMLNFFTKLRNLLYIFQQEEYEILPFLKWVKSAQNFSGLEKKQKLRWTLKARLLYVFVVLIWIGLLVGIYFCAYTVCFLEKHEPWVAILQGLTGFILLLGTIYFWTHWYLILVSLFLKPLDYVAKSLLLIRAKHQLKKYPKLKIVGITGSYGKTSVKEFLETLLKEKYRVLKTPENINTPLGIAALLKKENLNNYDVFLVEMGAYRRGDIQKVCDLVSPEMGILTGINESHLERFGSLENTIKTKFELIESLPSKGVALVNVEDENVKTNFQKFGRVRKKMYSSDFVENLKLNEKGISFEMRIGDENFEFNANILGKHNVTNLVGAMLMARELGMSGAELQVAVKKIKSVKHRLEPIFNPNGVLVIDDSYNGNPTGVRAAIEVLGQFQEKRKIFITPGLVELGEKKAELHREIGERLAQTCDLLILIKNSNLPYFLEGLQKGGWKIKNDDYSQEMRLKVFETSKEAHAALGGILKIGDVILFQNDWTDNYV